MNPSPNFVCELRHFPNLTEVSLLSDEVSRRKFFRKCCAFALLHRSPPPPDNFPVPLRREPSCSHSGISILIFVILRRPRHRLALPDWCIMLVPFYISSMDAGRFEGPRRDKLPLGAADLLPLAAYHPPQPKILLRLDPVHSASKVPGCVNQLRLWWRSYRLCRAEGAGFDLSYFSQNYVDYLHLQSWFHCLQY